MSIDFSGEDSLRPKFSREYVVACQSWCFHADLERTRAFCGGCRVKWDHIIPELNDFFDRLGIDLDRPVSIEEDGSLCYLLYGTAASDYGYELDFYAPGEFVSIAVLPYPDGYQGSGLDIREACVLLELFGAEKSFRTRACP